MDSSTTSSGTEDTISFTVPVGTYSEFHTVTTESNKRWRVRRALPKAMPCARSCVCLLCATLPGTLICHEEVRTLCSFSTCFLACS